MKTTQENDAGITGGDAGLDAPRRFEFSRDTFAFANELLWEYRMDDSGKTTFCRREPKPGYAHRCFVVVRAARQFLYHARFEPGQPTLEESGYRQIIQKIIGLPPRQASRPENLIVVPGFAGLREFSRAFESLLKSECGAAWRSYVLRSHWRMVLPISREHQSRTVASLTAALAAGRSPIVHLVTFPALTINHGMLVFDVSEQAEATEFSAYDPNDPGQPTRLRFDRASRTFNLRRNKYWAGGKLNVIEIYRNWLM